MTKAQAAQYLTEKGIEVLAARMDAGVPKVTIAWADYPKLLFPVRDSAVNRDFNIALR